MSEYYESPSIKQYQRKREERKRETDRDRERKRRKERERERKKEEKKLEISKKAFFIQQSCFIYFPRKVKYL